MTKILSIEYEKLTKINKYSVLQAIFKSLYDQKYSQVVGTIIIKLILIKRKMAIVTMVFEQLYCIIKINS